MSGNINKNDVIVPFLKWAGGKRWFCESHLNRIPQFDGLYIEPFLGSGAVFFALRPKKALLSDLNADLITTYKAVRDAPFEVYSLLKNHHVMHTAEHYYNVRSSKPKNPVSLAAWFIYLNRTCFNGLYRVNRQNEFNVPIGSKTSVVLETDDFFKVAARLVSSELRESDFESTIDLAQKDDFLFVDPPYTVKHNFNGFIKYNDRIFSWEDQIRLRNAVARAAARGAKIMVLNANHESIRELYSSVGMQIALSRASVLAASSAKRAVVEELLVCTWLSPNTALQTPQIWSAASPTNNREAQNATKP